MHVSLYYCLLAVEKTIIDLTSEQTGFIKSGKTWPKKQEFQTCVLEGYNKEICVFHFLTKRIHEHLGNEVMSRIWDVKKSTVLNSTVLSKEKD